MARPRKTPSDYGALAAKHGLTWLGPEVSSVMKKTGWRCERGHTWQARYNDLQQGSGCLQCFYLSQAIPPEQYKTLAQEQGFIWLGPEVSSVMKKTRWQCSRGHTWLARYNDIQQGNRCLQCFHLSLAIPPEQYQALAKERGYIWLGPEVFTVMKKTGWQCGQGHQWQMRYKDLRSGESCPTCARLARQRTSMKK